MHHPTPLPLQRLCRADRTKRLFAVFAACAGSGAASSRREQGGRGRGREDRERANRTKRLRSLCGLRWQRSGARRWAQTESTPLSLQPALAYSLRAVRQSGARRRAQAESAAPGFESRPRRPPLESPLRRVGVL